MLHNNIFFALIFALCGMASAVSSGRVGECNAHSPKFGCRHYGRTLDTWKENRFDCRDANATSQVMTWVKAPVRSENYAVQAPRCV